MTSRVLEIDPIAVIWTPKAMRYGRLLNSEQIISLFQTAAWWSVFVCAIFALVAAAASTQDRTSLVAALGVVGVPARAQRMAWLWYTSLPLIAAIVLGTFTAFLADWAFLTVLEVDEPIPLEPVWMAAGVGFILSAIYTLIALQAASNNVQIHDLRRD